MRKSAMALFALILFGCTTLRVPVSSLDDGPLRARGSIASPELELWLESGQAVPPSESATALKAAQAAIRNALGRREIEDTALGAQDAVLLVRERAIARTASHRRDQTLAKVGMVVGVVVVVAVVIAIATSGHSSSGKGGTAVGKAAGNSVPGPVAAVAHGVGPVAKAGGGAIARGGHPGAFTFGPGNFDGGDFFLGSGWNYYEPEQPFVLLPPNGLPPNGVPPTDDEWTRNGLPPPPGPPQSDAAAAGRAEDVPPPPPPPDLRAALPVLPDFPVAERGFFDADDTLLEFDLLDRATGQLLWTKVVRGDADPRDSGDVAKLTAEALDGEPWARPISR